LTNAEYNAEVRLFKNGIYKLADALQLPDDREFMKYNGLIVEPIPVSLTSRKRKTWTSESKNQP